MIIPDFLLTVDLPRLEIFILSEVYSWTYTPQGKQKPDGVCVMNSKGFAKKFGASDGGIRKALSKLRAKNLIEEYTASFGGREMRAFRLTQKCFCGNTSVSVETVPFPQERFCGNGGVSVETESVSVETHTPSITPSITPLSDLEGKASETENSTAKVVKTRRARQPSRKTAPSSEDVLSIYALCVKHTKKPESLAAIERAIQREMAGRKLPRDEIIAWLAERARAYRDARSKLDGTITDENYQFSINTVRFFDDERYNDDEKSWITKSKSQTNQTKNHNGNYSSSSQKIAPSTSVVAKRGLGSALKILADYEKQQSANTDAADFGGVNDDAKREQHSRSNEAVESAYTVVDTRRG